MADQAFYTEDVCTLRSAQGKSIGIIDRTTNDVDTHTPHPERDYDQLKCHKDISAAEFELFKKRGIPPLGTVLVEWQTQRSSELIHTKHLLLVDRALLVGDIVKRHVEDSMSGTVVETRVTCTLNPAAVLRSLEQGETGDSYSRHELQLERLLFDIPADEIKPANDFPDGGIIIYRDWVGRIEDVFDEVTIRLPNQSVVHVENADELSLIHRPTDRFEVGDIVKTTKRNLKRGEWIVGAYDNLVSPIGDVVNVRPVEVTVSWLCRRLHSSSPANGQHAEPPSHLDARVLHSGQVHVYDRSQSPRDATSSYGRCVDFLVGTGVRFKDPAGAAMKYDGTAQVGGSNHKNIVSRVLPSATLGFDLNVYIILSLKTKATVLWQDCSMTTEESTTLIPDINLEDESEVWPGEVVVTQESASAPGHDWILQPKRVGVVQSVSASDRLATVLWLPDAKLQYHNIDDLDGFMPPALLPGSTLGLTLHPHATPHLNTPSNAVSEDVTLYDIRAADGLNKRRGDFVILHPPEEVGLNISGKLDWIGEVIDLGNDGFLTVRLGACQPVKDVRIAPEFATIVYSSDMPPNDAGLGSDYDTEDDGSYETGSDVSEDGQWESLNGQPVSMEDSDADAWSTEAEDDEADDGAQWSQSVPESDPHYDQGSIDNVADISRREYTLHATDLMEGVETQSDRSKDIKPYRPDIPLVAPQLNPETPLYTRTDSSPLSFTVLETSPPDSTPYLTPPPSALSTQLMKRILREHRILESSLPDGIFVRSWESRLDLLRVLIIGPLDTPYEFAPFIIDIKIPATYPREPPIAYFHSWTKGQGPVNPNLYENGKICLSLLGTWHADEKGENWNAARSTILQVLVSILGLVLVKEPYFNEAGFEVRAGLADATVPSALYSERTYFRSRAFITHALTNDVSGFDDVVQWLYINREASAPKLLERAIAAAKEVLDNGDAVKRGGLSRISRGALVMLKRELQVLEEVKIKTD